LGSDAAQSPIYVLNSIANKPPSNTGTVLPQYWYDANSIFTISAGSYQCNTSPNNGVISVPDVGQYEFTDHLSIAQRHIYRFIDLDPEVADSDETLLEFLETVSQEKVVQFMKVEEHLY